MNRGQLTKMSSSRTDGSPVVRAQDESNNNVEVLKRLEEVLAQDRGVMNFEHYRVSPQHTERFQKLKQSAPELYENPTITPRSKWFQHPRWNSNSQMPPYHIHYRQEMKAVLKSLHKAYKYCDCQDDNNKTKVKQQQEVKNAVWVFQSSMRGLHGHVNIEEYACFPLYQRIYPHVDIQFLYHDHKELHVAEKKVMQSLQTLQTKLEQDNVMAVEDGLLEAIKDTLEFDDHLMSHLGEEEEIVVPMSLTEKEIWF